MCQAGYQGINVYQHTWASSEEPREEGGDRRAIVTQLCGDVRTRASVA